MQTPVAIGAWPEPFVHGYDGHRHPVSVGGLGCAARIAGALAQRTARRSTSGTAPYRVDGGDVRPGRPASWPTGEGRGLTVSLTGRAGDGLPRQPTAATPLPAAHALIAGYQPPGAPGDGGGVVVAGDDQQSACAAAATAGRPHPLGAGHLRRRARRRRRRCWRREAGSEPAAGRPAVRGAAGRLGGALQPVLRWPPVPRRRARCCGRRRRRAAMYVWFAGDDRAAGVRWSTRSSACRG